MCRTRIVDLFVRVLTPFRHSMQLIISLMSEQKKKRKTENEEWQCVVVLAQGML